MRGFHIRNGAGWVFEWDEASNVLVVSSLCTGPIKISCGTAQQAREIVGWLFEA